MTGALTAGVSSKVSIKNDIVYTLQKYSYKTIRKAKMFSGT